MADNGVKTTNQPSVSTLDELLGNKDGSTGRLSVSALANQLAASGALADLLARHSDATGNADSFDELANLLAEGGAVADILAELLVATTYATIVKATWTDLSAVSGAAEGTGAEVLDSDTGTHLAATATGYDGASVNNAGRYSWNATWSRWVRIGDTGLSSKASIEQVKIARWEVDRPGTFTHSVTGSSASAVFTLSWATARLLDGAGIRKIRDLAATELANLECLYVDTSEAYVDPGYTVQTGNLSTLASSFVSGDNVLLFGNYYGLAFGAFAGMAATDTALEAAAMRRRWTSGTAITTRHSAEGVKIKTTRGYHYREDNGGTYAHKIAAVAETTLSEGAGLMVDLDGTPNGDGELVPVYVSIASGLETVWETGQRLVLIALDGDGRLFGEYQLNAHVGAFDGEACFLLNSGDALPEWNDATRTLSWPDLLFLRHTGNTKQQNRVKLEAGSIVVPSGGFQTVVLDLAQIDDTLTPNMAVSVGQYIDPTPGWFGAEGAVLPLFAVGYGFAYPIRFPPTRGSTSYPSLPEGSALYAQDEIVARINGTDQVDVYMKGSNPTSYQYLRYPMKNVPDAGIGSDVWRWTETFEAERTGDMAFTTGLSICNSGEVETAIMIDGKTDFMGGNAHGDEIKVWDRLLIDGVEVSLSTAADYRCRRVELMQKSELFEPDTATPQSNLIATAYKRWVFEAGDVEIFEHLVFDAAVTLKQTYLAMLPILRLNGATQITDTGYVSPLYEAQDISVDGFTPVYFDGKIAKISGPNGYSAEVEILEGWDKPNRRFNFSPAASYNKLYFDFTGADYPTLVGEVMEARTRYRLDTSN